MVVASITLIAAILSGIAYRMGGSGNYPRQARIVGVSAITCIALFLLGIHSWWLLLVMGLSCGAVSAYYQQDEKKWGYWAHGLGLSLAVLPIVFLSQHWLGFSIRCLVLTGAITLWSQFTKNAVVEEFGRGFIIVSTIPLLLI